jgi:hypothetical protein
VPCVKFEDPLDWTCVRERAGILYHLCAGVVRAQTEGEAVSTSSLTRPDHRAPIELAVTRDTVTLADPVLHVPGKSGMDNRLRVCVILIFLIISRI